MSITQQYALDLYRSTRHGSAPAPAPGTHDWRTIRELRESHLESRRVRVRVPRPPRGTGRAGALRQLVARALRRPRTTTAGTAGTAGTAVHLAGAGPQQPQCCA